VSRIQAAVPLPVFDAIKGFEVFGFEVSDLFSDFGFRYSNFKWVAFFHRFVRMARRDIFGMERPMLKFMIIADDLSGACDTAVQFQKFGYRTLVLGRIESVYSLAARYDAIAVTTNSRDLKPDDARNAVRALCPCLKKLDRVTLYKKIDSTWRGNIGPELEVLIRELRFRFALICSAFPENMRAGIGGYLLVDGVLLHRTPMARDPSSPITEGYLPSLLSRQTDLPVAHLPLRLIESGADAVCRFLQDKIQDGPCLFIADAVEHGHLDILASISGEKLGPFLYAGSAGLSSAVLRQRRVSGGASCPIFSQVFPPVLTVSGSVHPKSIAQIDKLIETYHIGAVYIPSEAALHPDAKRIETLKAQARRLLVQGKDLVVRTCRSAADRQSASVEGEKDMLTGSEVAGTISDFLRDFIIDILPRGGLGGIMVTGGTTALKLLEGVSGEGIEVAEEIEPGVPIGRIVGGRLDGFRILTKAGGFGSLEVFCTGMEAMRKEG